MAGGKEIKRRIKLVKTTSQITRAMELVAATKMRKAEADARASRSYAERGRILLERLAMNLAGVNHPLLMDNTDGKILALVISPDRGLAGGLATNLFRDAARVLSAFPQEETEVMVIGKRGQDHFKRRGFNIIATASRLDWKPSVFDIRTFAKIAIDGYESKKYKKVIILYTHFLSSAVQKPTERVLLPFAVKKEGSLENGISPFQYLIEPSPEEVIGPVIRNLVEVAIYQSLLESNASEHSARMIAMHAATKNAKELADDLTFTFNQLRQESITREIAEISAGAA